jgi:16S rRNA (guanine966-N2)-methyltransferase
MARPQNKVRIGGGNWRSRLLHFPDLPGLRPTPDRVRQTVFNWLGQDLQGMACLDLFAGTGVMGFEALSREAAQAVMVERAAPACRALQENKALLQAERARIVHIDAVDFLQQSHERFDVIFLDPPYHQDWLPRLLPQLHAHLAPQGRLYAEAENALDDGEGWHVLKRGKAGNVFYHLLESVHE